MAVDCGGLILGVGKELGLLDFDTRAYGRGAPFSLIHAYADAGACVEHGADLRWLRRIVAAYSFRQPD